MKQKKKIYIGCVILLVLSFFLINVNLINAAEMFPTRPVELIVPAPPGGGTDIMARILSEAIEPFLGQKMVVINKPGGSGTIGLSIIAQAKPDGYTLGCLWNSPLTMVPNMLKVSFTPDDYTYITTVAKGPMIFCVRSEFPAKTPQEFFEYARKNPGKLTYAGDGVGNIVHFSGERVFHAMNVKLRLVPYGGAGESIKALLGGHVDVYGGTVPPALPHIKAGTVRPLFITTKERIEALPDVIGVEDLGHPQVETYIWRGILGPKGIPIDRIGIIDKAVRQAAQTEKVKDQLKKLGEMTWVISGKQFEEQVRQEITAMATIAKQLGLSPK